MTRASASSLLLAAVTALALAPVARAGDREVLHALVGSEAEAKGDFEAWTSELLDAVVASPESPYAYACLRKVQGLLTDVADPSVAEQKLEPLLLSGVADGNLDELIRDVLSDRARARGGFEAATRYRANAGYLREFAVIGPFGTENDAMVNRHFPPETAKLDISQPMEGARGQVRWLRYRAEGDSAWVSPYQQIRQGGTGVTYALARVQPRAPGTVALKVWCSESFQVLVNGRVAISVDRTHDHVPNPVWGEAHLAAGWNRIVVKIVGSSAFALRVVDAATGKPLEDLKAGDPMEAGELPAAGPAPRPRTYTTPSERAAAQVGDDTTDPLLLAGAAYLADDSGREWEALDLFERAAAAALTGEKVGASNVHAACGRFLAGFGPYPQVQRKLRAKEQFEAAIAAYPLHNSGNVRLANYENEDDHPDRAMRALEEYLQKNPTGTAFMAMAEIARARDWEREAIDAAQSALGMQRSAPDAQRFLARYDRRYGDQESYLARMQWLLARDADDDDAANAILDQMQNEGRHDEALAMLRERSARSPLSVDLRARIAGTLRRLGRYDEALATWQDLSEFIPDEEVYYREAAEILEILGRDDEALAMLRRGLEKQPFQPALWRWELRLTGQPEDFAAEYEPDADQIIASLPSTEELKQKYPKAVAITVLDHMVTEVRKDGSSRSYVHMIYKLLDEKGVEKYGNMPNSGELLDIRAIQPDGTVMTPTGMGRGSYNMEGLIPGTIIQHRFMSVQRAGPKGYDFGQFYFQDFDLRNNPNPVLLSRFVVIGTGGIKLDPKKRNFDGEPVVETRDGAVVTTWEKRDMPRIEREALMPDRDEIVPHVLYSQEPSFEDANWSYLGSRGDTRPNPVLRKALAGVVTAGMTDLEKLHAIYDFVNTEITGDYGGGSPAAILMEKAGDRGALFEALVRTAGIRYHTARAMRWNGHAQDLLHPDPSAFSTGFLWLLPEGADPVPFFMGSRYTPFGLVPDPFRGSAAFVASERGGWITRLPEGGVRTDDGSEFEITLGGEADQVTVAGSIHYRSPGTYGFKKTLIEMSLDDRRKLAEGQLSQYFANPTLTESSFPGMEVRGTPLEIRLEGTMATYLSRQGERYVVSLGLPPIDMTGRFVDREERVYDLVLNLREDRVDAFTIDLGGAFEVASLPESHVTVNDVGTYSLTWRLDRAAGKIHLRRERHFHPTRYRADEYLEFVAWCKAIDEAEERRLELVKRP